MDAHRDTLRQPHPGEDRVDVGNPLPVGLRVGDIDRAGDAVDMAAHDVGIAISFLVGTGIAVVAAAIIAFAVLPGSETFAAFCVAIGVWLVPSGAAAAQPWQKNAFTYMSVYLVPLLAPANQMSYDTLQFYNSALAILAGAGVAALSFRLIPPLSPAFGRAACRR